MLHREKNVVGVPNRESVEYCAAVCVYVCIPVPVSCLYVSVCLCTYKMRQMVNIFVYKYTCKHESDIHTHKRDNCHGLLKYRCLLVYLVRVLLRKNKFKPSFHR